MGRLSVIAARLVLAGSAVWWVLAAVLAGVPPSGWDVRARSELSSLDGRLKVLLGRAVYPDLSSPADVPPMAAGLYGRPASWSCSGESIRWAVDLLGLPPDGVAMISTGLARITAVSGLRFVYTGQVNVPPTPTWVPSPGGPEVLIGWVARSSPLLAPPAPRDAVAMTEVVVQGSHLIGAAVAFDAAEWRTLSPGFGAGTTRGGLALHELLHVVGIGDQSRWLGDLSYRRLIPRSAASFGAGDLAGLRELGCPIRTLNGAGAARPTR